MLLILSTIIFETNSSLYVKEGTTEKVQFPFLRNFVPVLIKSLFWREDWALGYNYMEFRDFPDIS